MNYCLFIGLMSGVACISMIGIDANATDNSRASITFGSEPEGVKVHVQKYSKKGKKRKGHSCITPCSMKIKMDRYSTFRFDKDGYAGGTLSRTIRKPNKSFEKLIFTSPDFDAELATYGVFQITLRTPDESLALKEEMRVRDLERKMAWDKKMAQRRVLEEKARAAHANPQEAVCPEGDENTSPDDIVPLIRIPPIIPREAFRMHKSGHCKMRFDINPLGVPRDIEAVSCSDPVFEAASINSTKRWYYQPKLEDDKPVSQCGVEAKIKFILKDDRGATLPE